MWFKNAKGRFLGKKNGLRRIKKKSPIPKLY
jgi:hypothetical protein